MFFQSLTTTFSLKFNPKQIWAVKVHKSCFRSDLRRNVLFSFFPQMEILCQLLTTLLTLIRRKCFENVCIQAGHWKSTHKISNLIFHSIFLWVVHWFILNKLILSFPMRICILVQCHCTLSRSNQCYAAFSNGI